MSIIVHYCIHKSMYSLHRVLLCGLSFPWTSLCTNFHVHKYVTFVLYKLSASEGVIAPTVCKLGTRCICFYTVQHPWIFLVSLKNFSQFITRLHSSKHCSNTVSNKIFCTYSGKTAQLSNTQPQSPTEATALTLAGLGERRCKLRPPCGCQWMLGKTSSGRVVLSDRISFGHWGSRRLSFAMDSSES